MFWVSKTETMGRLAGLLAWLLALHGCTNDMQGGLHAGEGDVSAEERHKRECAMCPDMELHKDIKDPGEAEDEAKADRGKELLTAFFCVQALHGDDGVMKIAPKAMACMVQKIAKGVPNLLEVAEECSKEAAKHHDVDEEKLEKLMSCLKNDGATGGKKGTEYAEKGDGLRDRFGNGFIKSQELAQLFEPPEGTIEQAKMKPLQWEMVNKLMTEFRYAVKYMVKKYLMELTFQVEDAIKDGKTGTGEPEAGTLELQSRAEHEPPEVHPRAVVHE